MTDNDQPQVSGPENRAQKLSKAAAKIDGQQPVPYLLEFSLTISKVVIILVGILVTTIAWLRGVALWHIALRSGVAMLSLGILFWSLNWVLSQNALEVAREYQKKSKKEKKLVDQEA